MEKKNKNVIRKAIQGLLTNYVLILEAILNSSAGFVMMGHGLLYRKKRWEKLLLNGLF